MSSKQDDPKHGGGYIPPPEKYKPRFHQTSFRDTSNMEESIQKFTVTESTRKSASERGSHGGNFVPDTDGQNPKV